MSKAVFSAKHFHDEAAAYAYVEARVWPQGPVCPKCGTMDRVGKLRGKSTRIGTYKCYECRKPFTVKVGTIFEDSHVPMHLWLQAMHFMCSSKKGVSSNQLHRTLGVTLKTAWFMSHRIRLAMAEGSLAPMGGNGGDVQVDETFIGKDKDAPPVRHSRFGYRPAKLNVLSLVDRATGKSRSFVVETLQAKDVEPILRDNIAKDTRLVTDEAKRYIGHGRMFASHVSVNHSKEEYVSKDDPTITTNHVENFFGVFKRGMKGTYQHCSKEHLHRYVAEFDFRYNNRVKLGCGDVERAERALKGVVGKRLLYRDSSGL